MLGEDYSQKVSRVSIRAGRVASNTLTAIFKAVLQELVKVVDHRTPKKSLKRITRDAAAVDNVPFAKEDIRDFKQFARKYNVQFAVVVNTTDPSKVDLVFKTRQQGNLTLALSKYLESKAKMQERGSVKVKLAKATTKVEAAKQNLQLENVGKVVKSPAVSR